MLSKREKEAGVHLTPTYREPSDNDLEGQHVPSALALVHHASNLKQRRQQVAYLLWAVLWLCIFALCVLTAKVHFRSEAMQDCARSTEAFKTQLDVAKDQLFLARSEYREADHERIRVRTELEELAVRLKNLVIQIVQLKEELVQLMDNYIVLKQEIKGMYSHSQVVRSEAVKLEMQGRQLEQQLKQLHRTSQAIEASWPSAFISPGQLRGP